MITTNTKEWLSIILQVITLFSIVYSAVKIVNRNEREWVQKEDRISVIENNIKEMKASTIMLVALESKITELSGEMIRVRDRLDRFLDMQSPNIRK